MQIWLKRAYDAPGRWDGTRVLIDRLWPRGISRRDAAIDHWARDAAPSDGLRTWFGHDPARWAEFRRRYIVELGARPEAVAGLCELARAGRLTLVFGAKDEKHNNAVVLKEYLKRNC